MPIRPYPVQSIWRAQDSGFVAWTGDPAAFMAAAVPALVSGTQYVSMVKVDRSAPIAAVRFYVATAGTSITEASVDVFDSAGVSIATADVAAVLASVNFKNVAFAVPTGIRSVGEKLYVGIRATFGGTAPALRGVSLSALCSANLSGANLRYGIGDTGLAAPQSSINPAGLADAGTRQQWFGLL